MKIAVCFSTQIRTGVHVANNIKNYLGDLYQYCDFFAHFWDVDTLSQNDINSKKLDTNNFTKLQNSPIKVNPQTFSDFYKIYNPISMVIEPYLMSNYEIEPGGRRYNNNTKSYVISLFESIYECNKLKCEFEKKYNFKYDYVVRLRPDLVIHPEKSLKDDLLEVHDDNSLLYAAHKRNKNYINNLEDIFWLSKSETMDKISLFYEYESNTDLDKEIFDYDWQKVMYGWVIDTLKISPIKLKNSTMCPYYVSDLKINADIMGTEIYERQY